MARSLFSIQKPKGTTFSRQARRVARSANPIFLLGPLFLLIACSPFPNVEALVPPVGNVGDMIDVRDSTGASLTPQGTVYFGNVEAATVFLWTPEDVFLQVPSGITNTVPVRIVIDGLPSNMRNFLLLENVDLHRILCFGDSILHWGVPQLVQDLIDQDPDLGDLDLLVLDQAKNGEKVTGDGTWTRWQNALIYSDPELVVLLEGTNDVADSSYESMEDIQQRYMEMTEEALTRNVDPVLCTLPPRAGSCGDQESPTTEEFNDWLRSYADAMSIPLVDIYEAFLSTPDWENLYFTADCVHPNATGLQKIAERLTNKIAEMYLPACTDLDEDGYGDPASPACSHPGPDCDDTDPNVHPDAPEDCLNGIDDDCDGDTDGSDLDCME